MNSAQEDLAIAPVVYKEGRGKDAPIKYSCFGLYLNGEVIIEATKKETIEALYETWRERIK